MFFCSGIPLRGQKYTLKVPNSTPSVIGITETQKPLKGEAQSLLLPQLFCPVCSVICFLAQILADGLICLTTHRSMSEQLT